MVRNYSSVSPDTIVKLLAQPMERHELVAALGLKNPGPAVEQRIDEILTIQVERGLLVGPCEENGYRWAARMEMGFRLSDEDRHVMRRIANALEVISRGGFAYGGPRDKSST